MSFLTSLLYMSSSKNVDHPNETDTDDKAEVYFESSENLDTQNEIPPTSTLDDKNAHISQVAISQRDSLNHVHFRNNQPAIPLPRTIHPPEGSIVDALPGRLKRNVPISRLRSLSKVFTTLPNTPLPSYSQMVVDQIEFLMHVILLETDPMRTLRHQQHLFTAVEVFQNKVPNGKALMQSGRLYSRMMLTSLACDIVTFSVDGYEGDDVCPAFDLPPEGWTTIKNRLISVKDILIKKNANNPINFDVDSIHVHDEVDEQLSNHVMMTTDFNEVIRLFSVHEELALLRDQLEEVKDEIEAAAGSSNESILGNSSERSTNKSIERCVNAFMKNLSIIFPPDPMTTDDDDIDDGIELEEETEVNNARTISNIPKELHSLALTELYSPKQHPQASNLAERLLADIYSITSATDLRRDSTMNSGVYSFSNLQSKVRSLLMKWSESILEVPTLILLGYGGVPSPIVDKDEDDVSSWGSGDAFIIDTEERRRNNSRSRSFSKLLNATCQGRSISLTDDDKELISRLVALVDSSQNDPQYHIDADNIGEAKISGNSSQVPVADMATYMSAPANEEMSTDKISLNQKSINETKVTIPPLNSPIAQDSNAIEVEQESNISLDNKDRKDIKRGRRLWLSVMGKRNENVSNLEKVNPLKRGLDSILNETMQRPAKVTRRNNIWAMNQRKKMHSMTVNLNADVSENSSMEPLISENSIAVGHAVKTVSAHTNTNSPLLSPSKRNPFTDEEVKAIVLGLKTFGVGKWAEIQASDDRLANRTPVQLKDKYRTMLNRGEV